LYGSEVWGVGKNENIEKVHLQFLKRILGVRVTTPNCLVYGELGRYPLPYNMIGATSQSKMFSCKSIGSCRFLIL
jgi:hypothetical protein